MLHIKRGSHVNEEEMINCGDCSTAGTHARWRPRRKCFER